MMDSVFGAIWSILTLPFRLVAWVIQILGRVVGGVVGFALMVVGVAFMAGPLFVFGIPLFIIGLLLALRSVG